MALLSNGLQLRDAVAVFAAGQYHFLAAIGAAGVLKLLQRLGQLALFEFIRLGQRHHIGDADGSAGTCSICKSSALRGMAAVQQLHQQGAVAPGLKVAVDEVIPARTLRIAETLA